MSVRFRCPICHTMLQAPATALGKPAKCKSCGTKVRVPEVIASADRSSQTAPDQVQTTSAHPAAGQSSETEKVQCSNCSRTLRVPAGSAGKKLKCPCGAIVSKSTSANRGALEVEEPFFGTLVKPVASEVVTPVNNWFNQIAQNSAESMSTPAAYSSPFPPLPLSMPTSADATHAKPPSSMANMYLANAQAEAAQDHYAERGETWKVDWAKVGGGTMAMLGATVWFVLGLKAGRIFLYPPVMFLFGLIAVVNGLFAGE